MGEVFTQLLPRPTFSSAQRRLRLHAFLNKARSAAMSVTVVFAAVRPSPSRRGVARYLSKLLAQVWLVGEPASQRYITQRRLSLQHVLSRQLDATPDHEGMRGVAESAPEGAREMRFAKLHKRAEIGDRYRICDMTINIGTHFACLPSEQAPSYVWGRLRDFGINLLPQQRGGFKYSAVNRLSVIKLTSGGIEQRDYAVHPFAWPCRSDPRHSLCLPEVSVHNLLHTPPAAASVDVTGTSLNKTYRQVFMFQDCY
jgi:hypothetical protein